MRAARLFAVIVVYMLSFLQSFGKSPTSKAELIAHFHDRLTGEMVYSALRGDEANVDMLIGSGAKINKAGDDGLSPLIVAVLSANKKAVLTLLKRGADPNQQDKDGDSAMSLAAQMVDLSFVDVLLQNRGNVNVVNRLTKTTPLFNAIDAHRLENVQFLVQHGANIDAKEEHQETPIHVAGEANQYDIILFLLNAGANPKATNVWGKTIEYYILHNGFDPKSPQAPYREKVIDFLKKRGMLLTK